MTPGRRVLVSACSVALTVCALGVPLMLMLAPPYTAALVLYVDAPEIAGLDPVQTQELAEQVRAFVAGEKGSRLPASTSDGRPAFDEKALAHLADVRDLLHSVRLVTYVAIVATAAWFLITIRARWKHELSISLLAAALGILATMGLAAALACADFEWFFTAFHGVFFTHGTWQFPGDALLIGLFPERFWIVSAAVWGVLSSLIAVVLGVWGWWGARRASRGRE
ncbi:MAG: DUF1461 domain-containing protein [Coriobacteriia bacterium]|nr:DUF1461 domain-containing protein [Coriobacteriia bacterium]